MLKLHLKQCEKKRNFIEAESVNRKIKELQDYEKEKVYQNILKKQDKEKENFQEKIEERREKIEEEREKKENLFNYKIDNLIEEFTKKQSAELENFKDGISNSLPSKPGLFNLTKKYEQRIKECIRKQEYLKANDLTNELEVQKDRMIEQHEREREIQIQKAIEKVVQVQKKEKKEFTDKIKKLKNDFYSSQDKRYSRASHDLDARLDRFLHDQKVEAQNFDEIMKDFKMGYFLSANMQDQTRKYFQEIKEQERREKQEKSTEY